MSGLDTKIHFSLYIIYNILEIQGNYKGGLFKLKEQRSAAAGVAFYVTITYHYEYLKE